MTDTPTFRKLRPLIAADMPQPSLALGERAELCLLPLDRLVVDDRYQRAIGRQGKPNVLRILASFDWRKFTPVVVTPVGDGLYAVIDGQHRATAALMHPAIDMVPCMVIRVTPEEAAACFAAINGAVTKITAGQIWRARVRSGEASALALNRALEAAGVRVLAYKGPSEPYKVGDTFAIGTLESMFAKYGPEVLVTALQSITQSGTGNPGCVVAPMIAAMCRIVFERPALQAAPTTLFELMDEIGLGRVIASTSARAKEHRRPHSEMLYQTLAGYLDEVSAPVREAAE